MSIGIYCIVNKLNNKRYVGKSVDIERRFIHHKYLLTQYNRDKKKTNRHLFNAVNKYGIENFSFDIIEVFDDVNEELLSERELFWIDFYDSCNRKYGYNLRRDSSTKMIVHDETRKLASENFSGEKNPNYGNYWTDEQKTKMSNIAKYRHSELNVYGDEWKSKISEASKKMWKDEDKKKAMADKVSKTRSEKGFRFYQYDKKTLELVKVWESMVDILSENPDYHNIAIYSVCNGYKKSYRGFIWRKESKI